MAQVLEKRTLDCTDVVTLLCDYVDDELMPALTARVDDHLERCQYCRSILDSYQKTVKLAHDLPEKPVSIGSQNRLRANLNKRLGLSLPFIK
jgi:anti-sigma factor RsiW